MACCGEESSATGRSAALEGGAQRRREERSAAGRSPALCSKEVHRREARLMWGSAGAPNK